MPAYSYSAEWVLIGKSPSGDNFYIDETSVKRSQGLSTVKERQEFMFGQISRDGNIYIETVLVKTYNCSNQTFSILEAVGYDNGGNAVFSEKFEQYYIQNPDKRWSSISPNSMFVKSYNIACK